MEVALSHIQVHLRQLARGCCCCCRRGRCRCCRGCGGGSCGWVAAAVPSCCCCCCCRGRCCRVGGACRAAATGPASGQGVQGTAGLLRSRRPGRGGRPVGRQAGSAPPAFACELLQGGRRLLSGCWRRDVRLCWRAGDSRGSRCRPGPPSPGLGPCRRLEEGQYGAPLRLHGAQNERSGPSGRRPSGSSAAAARCRRAGRRHLTWGIPGSALLLPGPCSTGSQFAQPSSACPARSSAAPEI